MLNSPLYILLAVLLSYLIGSLSFGIITCKLMGLPDPRSQGSKNPGATNVLRFGGKKATIMTLLGDTLKGVLTVLVGKFLGFDTLGLSLIAFATFVGHLYPIFFGFRGGKGVATALGCLLALYWPLGLLLMGTWLLTTIVFRYSSLAALVAAGLAPLYAWFITDKNIFIMVCCMSALLIYRHKKNILNLFQGKEDKIGKKSG
jgi:acyl phosphate:glycerol-3-phosphate acyltransferase